MTKSKREAPKIIPGWTFLGEGSFNNAYKSNDGQFVLKIQKSRKKDLTSEIDRPLRSVRLWNELNSHLNAKASLFGAGDTVGWICPYIEGRQASDNEMSHALIDIYSKTGRIIVDATATNNFITTAKGEVVCVDIGMALKLHEDQNFSDTASISEDIWQDFSRPYDEFFSENKKWNPQATNTVKALLFLNKMRPDITDASFLKFNTMILIELANAYDNISTGTAKQNLDKVLKDLEDQKPQTFDSIKQSCMLELQRYIDSRGTVNTSGQFSPSLTTLLFRDTALTSQKVALIKDLQAKIENATNLNEINQAISSTPERNRLYKSVFKSGAQSAIFRCSNITRAATQTPYYQEKQSAQPRMDI